MISALKFSFFTITRSPVHYQPSRDSNASVNSKPDHPPTGDPRGFAHPSCPWGRIFAPLSCANFALSFKQMSSSSFHMFIYARSEQCDLRSIYTITNTQRIRIYPGKLNSSWSKCHLIQDVNMAKMPKETKLCSRFLLLRIYPTPLFT